MEQLKIELEHCKMESFKLREMRSDTSKYPEMEMQVRERMEFG